MGMERRDRRKLCEGRQGCWQGGGKPGRIRRDTLKVFCGSAGGRQSIGNSDA